ncbi:MAG: hypothetical protein ACYCQM_01520 [Acidithiobacillus sp.]
MERNQQIRISQFGNVLQIILEIPWQQVHGENTWKAYLERKAAEEAVITKEGESHWERISKRVIEIFKATGSISKAAKTNQCSYFIANSIIREETTRQNKANREAAKKQAQSLASAKVPIKSIAQIMGKSPETIRLWLKS